MVSIVHSSILMFWIIVFCIAQVISFLKDLFLKVAHKANIRKVRVLVLLFSFKKPPFLQGIRKIGNIPLDYVFLSNLWSITLETLCELAPGDLWRVIASFPLWHSFYRSHSFLHKTQFIAMEYTSSWSCLSCFNDININGSMHNFSISSLLSIIQMEAKTFAYTLYFIWNCKITENWDFYS